MEDEAVKAQFRQFYEDLVGSLTEPRRFYTERYPQMSQNHALAFGLGVSWLATALKWLTRVLNHESFMDSFIRIRDQLMQLPVWRELPTSIWAQNPTTVPAAFPAWIAEAGTVALYPFSFLLQIVISAVALTIGAYLFIKPRTDGTADRPDLTHFMKIAALASTPSIVGAILSFLPIGLGTTIGWLYAFLMLLFAVSIRYKVSMLRSFAVVVTPWFALAMAGACGLGLFGAVILGFIASLFGVAH